MGWKTGHEYTPPTCVFCGNAPAIMGSTRWRPYEGEACSDACGLKAKARIEDWMQSDQYKSIMRKLMSAQDELRIGEMNALAPKEPQRCAECNCENGGKYCNWIKSGEAPSE